VKQSHKKSIITLNIIFAIVIGVFVFAPLALAQRADLGIDVVSSTIGLPSTDIRIIVANIIRVFLGLLGIIVLGLFLYAGYLWMTSGGDDEKITQAKKIIRNAVIGLILILSSYAITSFVINKLVEGMGGIPGHCSNHNFDEDQGEEGEDCGGTCPYSCGYIPTDYRHFYIISATEGEACVRNVVPMIVFNKSVNIDTVKEGVKVLRGEADSATEVTGVWSEGEDRNVAKFTPNISGSCTPDAGNDCLGANATYTIKIFNSSAVKSYGVGGQTLECGYPESGGCDLKPFKTGSVVDREAPTVLISNPVKSPGSLLLDPWSALTGDRVTFTITAIDNVAVQNLNFYAGAYAISSTRFSGCQASVTHDFVWDTTNWRKGLYIIKSTAYDFAALFGTDQKQMELIPAHCYNYSDDNLGVEPELGEVKNIMPGGPQCGGECGSCDGDPCSTNEDCAYGLACVGGTCQPKMQIVNFSPASTTRKSYVSIFGYFFGDTVGDVYFAKTTSSPNPINTSTDWVKADVITCPGKNFPSWMPYQIIAELPTNATSGAIMVITASTSERAAQVDTTENDWLDFNWGPDLNYFIVASGTPKMGLCSIDPSAGYRGDHVTTTGKNLPTASGGRKLLFGDDFSAYISTGASTFISAIVPNAINDGRVGVKVKYNNDFSNSILFTVKYGSPDGVPFIEKIEPAEGARGEYITITGKNFGKNLGQVRFWLPPYASNTEIYGDFNSFPRECSADKFWTDKQIIVKFPGSGSKGVFNSEYRVQVYNSKTKKVNPFDDKKIFTLRAGDPKPGICALLPDNGPIPFSTTAPMKIVGEYFTADNFNAPIGLWHMDIWDWTDQYQNDSPRGDSNPRGLPGGTANIISSANKSSDGRVAVGTGSWFFNPGANYGIGPDTVLDNLSKNDFSLAFWMYPYALWKYPYESEGFGILQKGDVTITGAPGDRLEYAIFSNHDNELSFAAWSQTGQLIYFSTSTFDNDDWNNFVWTVGSQSETSRVYRNGVLASQNNILLPGQSIGQVIGTMLTIGETRIGKNFFGAGNPSVVVQYNFAGFLDEFSIYDRLLSDKEVLALFQQQTYTPSVDAFFWRTTAEAGTSTVVGRAQASHNAPFNFAGRVITVVPPTTTETGPVVVRRDGDFKISNPLKFAKWNCVDAGKQMKKSGGYCVDENFHCCTTGADVGVCRPNAGANSTCDGELRSTGYSWRFATHDIPEYPRVIERCGVETETLTGIVKLPTPSPATFWNNLQSNDHTNVCRTAAVIAEFSTMMSSTQLMATEGDYYKNISVYKCPSGGCLGSGAKIKLTSSQISVQVADGSGVMDSRGCSINTNYVQVTRNGGLWDDESWYAVVLSKDLQKINNADGNCGSSSTYKLMPSRPCPGIDPNGAYCFSFHTDSRACTLRAVLVTPYSYWTTYLEAIISHHIFGNKTTPVWYYGRGLSDQRCIMMDMSGYQWNWSSSNTIYADISAGSNRSSEKVTASSSANTMSIGLTDPDDAVNINATALGTKITEPIAWWKFGEVGTTTILDSVRNLRGRLVGDTSRASVPSGAISGSAIHLSNTTTYAVVEHNDSLSYSGGGMSWSLWFNIDPNSDPSVNPYGVLLAKKSLVENWDVLGKYDYRISLFDGKVSLAFAPQGFGVSSFGLPTGNRFAPSVYHHLVITASGGDRIAKIYVDGVLEATDRWSDQINWNQGSGDRNTPLIIGAAYPFTPVISPVNEADGFSGDIADVRIFNTALTGAEVSDLFSTGEIKSDVQSKTGHSPLTIDLSHPRIVDYWPRCQEVCPEAQVGARFNVNMSNKNVETVGGDFVAATNRSVELLKCIDENCSSTESVYSAQGGQANDDEIYFGENTIPAQTVLNIFNTRIASVNVPLATNTVYKVVISAHDDNVTTSPFVLWGAKNGDYTQTGWPYNEQFVWRFKTKTDHCFIDRVEVLPDLFMAPTLNARQVFTAQPYSSPDACNPSGQRLNAWGESWNWASSDSGVATISQFTTTGQNPNCTASCIRKGSTIPASTTLNFALCGNGAVEAGEDCDIGFLDGGGQLKETGRSCSLNCLRPGNFLATTTATVGVDAGLCGDGFVTTTLGEECDPRSADLSESVGCSTVCRHTGSPKTASPTSPDQSVCGNKMMGRGEECDTGVAPSVTNKTSSLGCSANCIHLGSQIDVRWCSTHWSDYSSLGFATSTFISACNTKVSVCGDGTASPDEDALCDVSGTGWNSNLCNDRCLLKNGNTGADNNSASGNVCASDLTTAGCDANRRHVGSSLNYLTPSVCGDGQVGLGEDATCEDVSQFINKRTSWTDSNGTYPWVDPWALGIGRGLSVDVVTLYGDQKAQVSTISANTTMNTPSSTKPDGKSYRVNGEEKTGSAQFVIPCGFTRDAECKQFGDDYALAANSCCYPRPRLTDVYPGGTTSIHHYLFPGSALPSYSPAPGEAKIEQDVCPNTAIEATFNTTLDATTLSGNVILARSIGNDDPAFGHSSYLNATKVNSALISSTTVPFKKIQVVGNFAYVDSSSTILTVNISNPMRPSIIGPANKNKNGVAVSAQDFFVSDNKLFTIGGTATNGYLSVVDVSNPYYPTYKGGVKRGYDILLPEPKLVTAQGSLVFVASKNVCNSASTTITAPIEIFEAGDGTNIIKRGTYYTKAITSPGCLTPMRIGVSGSRLFVLWSNNKVEIIDISNPSAPSLVKQVSSNDFSPVEAIRDAQLDGDELYVLTGSYIKVLNATTTALFSQANSLSANKIFVANNRLYSLINAAQQKVQVYNVAVKTNITPILSSPFSFVAAHFIELGSVNNLAVGENQIYISGAKSAVNKFYSISINSLLHSDVGTVYAPDTLVVSGDFAYALSSSSSLNFTIADISNPQDPFYVGTKNVYYSGTANHFGSLAVNGDYLYVAFYNSLRIINVANKNAPVITGVYEDPSYQLLSRPTNIWQKGNYVVVVDGATSSTLFFDVSSTTHPILTGQLTESDGGARLSGASGLAVSGNYAYIPVAYWQGQNIGGIEVVDISNPVAPAHFKFFDLTGSVGPSINHIAIADKIAYVTGNNSIASIDISDPANIVVLDKLTDPTKFASVSSIAVQGGLAYVTPLHLDRLVAVDLSNPKKLRVKSKAIIVDGGALGAHLDAPSDVFISGNNAFVAVTDGLEIADISQFNDTSCVGGQDVTKLIAGAFGSAEYDNLPWYKQLWTRLANFVRRVLGIGSAVADPRPQPLRWCAGMDKINSDIVYNPKTGESSITLSLLEPLKFNADYSVILKDGIRDFRAISIGTVSSADGVKPIYWRFVTANQICEVNKVTVLPAVTSFQRPNATSTLRAFVADKNSRLIQAIPGFYNWENWWGPENNPYVGVTKTTSSMNMLTAKNQNGELDIRDAVVVTENAYNSNVGFRAIGYGHVVVFLCENPWPPMGEPNNIFPYEDKVGNNDRFDVSSTVFNGEAIPPALPGGGYYNFRLYYCMDNGRSGNTTDDLPSLQPIVQQTPVITSFAPRNILGEKYSLAIKTVAPNRASSVMGDLVKHLKNIWANSNFGIETVWAEMDPDECTEDERQRICEERGYECGGYENSGCSSGSGVVVDENGFTSCGICSTGRTCTAENKCETVCGDSIVVGDEQCDGGDVGMNGCSATTCLPETGYVCADNVCHRAICGDGICDSIENAQDCAVDCSSANLAGAWKRFIFPNNKNNDVIGVQIFPNTKHLTAREWYSNLKILGGKEFAKPVQDLSIKGYDAVTDGFNVYVDVLNYSTTTQSLYSLMYLFSINANAGSETRKVFDQLIANVEFNINLSNDRYCIARTGVVLENADTACVSDLDCDKETSYCGSQVDKIKRDFQRLRDLRSLQSALNSSGQQGVSTPPSGAVAWWKLDSSTATGTKQLFTDSINGIIMDCSSNYCPTVTPVGHNKNSVQFSKNNEHFLSTGHSKLDGNVFSIETWIRPSGRQPDWTRIFEKIYSFDIEFNNLTKQSARFNVNIGSGLDQIYTVDSSVEIVPDQWNFIVATYDGKTPKLYINGSLPAVSGDVNLSTNTYPILIGRKGIPDSNGQYYFNGQMDDIVYYNRVLTPAEIGARYAGSASKYPALKEGTFLTGQTLTTWPSWNVLSNAIGVTAPIDPINKLGVAGTCSASTTIYCNNPDPAFSTCPLGQTCVIHDKATGWSTVGRRFSFACAPESLAYRYIVASSTGFEVRFRMEDPGVPITNWTGFAGDFINTDRFGDIDFKSANGICTKSEEIATIQKGYCGDKQVNVGSEDCDPPGSNVVERNCDSSGGGEIKTTVCSTACRWMAPTTSTCGVSGDKLCGNGSLDSWAGEICDDGKLLNGTYNHCNLLCKGKVPAKGFDCGAASTKVCAGDSLNKSFGFCGDATTTPSKELCDIYESMTSTTVSATSGVRYSLYKNKSCGWDCQRIGPYCGDGIIQTDFDEECDGNETCSAYGVSGIKKCGVLSDGADKACKMLSFGTTTTVENWFCSTTQPIATETKCGDNSGKFDPNKGEVCNQGANNGVKCAPSYGQPCQYCASDCTAWIEVKPTQFCGNGILEADEVCDYTDNGSVVSIFVSSTYSSSTDLVYNDPATDSASIQAHNGYLLRDCWNQPSTVNGLFTSVIMATPRKGGDIKQCINKCKNVYHNCVTCGINKERGMPVKIYMVNPLTINGIPSYFDLFFASSTNSVLSENYFKVADGNGTYDTVHKYIQLRDLRDSSKPALINLNPVCSDKNNNSQRYQLVKSGDTDSQNRIDIKLTGDDRADDRDVILSPIMSIDPEVNTSNGSGCSTQDDRIPGNTCYANHLRIVVSWRNTASSFDFQPVIGFVSSSGYVENFHMDENVTSSSQRYLTQPFSDRSTLSLPHEPFPVWLHPSGCFEEGHRCWIMTTLDLSEENLKDRIAVYIRNNSPKPIPPNDPGSIVAGGIFNPIIVQQSEVKVEIYAPQSGYETNYSRPVATYYLRDATPSENPSAGFWYLFNLNRNPSTKASDLSNIEMRNRIVTSRGSLLKYFATGELIENQ